MIIMNRKLKKLLSIVLSINSVICGMPLAFAADVSQPYPAGTANSHLFRIPAMITLINGSVVTSADIRYGDGTDSPANIDTCVRYSEDIGLTWSEPNVVNHFYDFEDACSEKVIKKSASFIDSALLQSSKGSVFVICDACPAFIGSSAAKKNGNGLIDGKFVLCDKTTEDEVESGKLNKEAYPYYIDTFDDGFAPVKAFADGSNYKNYFVDEEFNLYIKNGEIFEKVTVNTFDEKGNKTDKLVQANVFYAASPVKIYPTFYTWLRRSEDNGKTWSKPYILNSQIKSRGFTGVCPGKGFSYITNDGERLIFAVYDNNEGFEKASTIYSDDNGYTWQRGEKIAVRNFAVKSSESQMVRLNNDVIRLYSRNSGKYIGFCDSTDGGKTWGNYYEDASLKYCSDCMVSFINYSKPVDGKKAVISAYPTTSHRKLGVIKVGFVDDKNNVTWAYEYKVTDSREDLTYIYSCLSELPDGRIALLYESRAAEITYKIFSIDELVNEQTAVKPFNLKMQKFFTKFLKVITDFICLF